MPNTPNANIYFFSKGVKPGLKNRTKLKGFIKNLIRKEGKKLGTLNFVFVSDNELLKINKAYLGHNFFTDVLTFDYSAAKNEIIGEVYISLDRVKDNSKHYKTPIYKELTRVIIHGVLHLCEYRDEKENQKKIMRTKEDYYLGLYYK